jgi:hypothetical protein
MSSSTNTRWAASCCHTQFTHLTTHPSNTTLHSHLSTTPSTTPPRNAADPQSGASPSNPHLTRVRPLSVPVVCLNSTFQNQPKQLYQPS